MRQLRLRTRAGVGCAAVALLVGCTRTAAPYRENTYEEERRLAQTCETVFLPKRRSAYFKRDYSTGAPYYHLRPDGTYVSVGREHFGVDLRDKGSWEQGQDGVLSLRSQMTYPQVEYGPLTVHMFDKRDFEGATALRDRIDDVLRRSSRAAFSRRSVERTCVGSRDPRRRGVFRPSVSVDCTVRAVTREQLAALSRALQEFIDSPDRNVFRYKPLLYRGVVFLAECGGDGLPTGRGLWWLDLLDDMGRLGRPRGFVLLQITEAAYQDESKRPYGFAYGSPCPWLDVSAGSDESCPDDAPPERRVQPGAAAGDDAAVD
ncbi:MAG: hypothetical protein ACYS9X_10955 [Planctomycetota bacterium]